MIRILDLLLALVGLIVAMPLLAAIVVAGTFETGSPLFRQVRVGRHQRPFTLVKFRTMRPGVPSVASHLADASTITTFGGFLRRTKLDELPQLWNVLWGDMSLVGPRPCLYSQQELIFEREARGVFNARPGITGEAQLSGVDMSTPRKLAEMDAYMLARLDGRLYLAIVMKTALGKGRGDSVRK